MDGTYYPSQQKRNSFRNLSPANRFRNYQGTIEINSKQYHLSDFLGKGGMGKVHVAYDDSGKKYALKLQTYPCIEIKKDTASRELLASRFNHPHVRRVIAADEKGIVMEYLPIFRTHDSHTPSLLNSLSFDDRILSSLEIVKRIASALDHIHEKGIVHRDIKSSNIILRNSSPTEAVLIDFGLASEFPYKYNGLLVGEPASIDPYILTGKPQDFAGDVYSLAKSLFDLIFSKSPLFESPTPIQSYYMKNDVLYLSSRLSSLPQDLQQFFHATLTPNRADRMISNAVQFEAEVETLIQRRIGRII